MCSIEFFTQNRKKHTILALYLQQNLEKFLKALSEKNGFLPAGFRIAFSRSYCSQNCSYIIDSIWRKPI
jgi:hypothetical protein